MNFSKALFRLHTDFTVFCPHYCLININDETVFTPILIDLGDCRKCVQIVK